MGEFLSVLLLSWKFLEVGEPRKAKGPVKRGDETLLEPNDFLRGEVPFEFDCFPTGLTCQVVGGGGVSLDLLPGGVPITNCTLGGLKEPILGMWFLWESTLLHLIVIGWERGTLFPLLSLTLAGEICWSTLFWVGTGIGSDIGRKEGLGGLDRGSRLDCFVYLDDIEQSFNEILISVLIHFL